MGDSEVINFSALEKELQAALEADRKYRRENDAKFRAIHQNVGSYEEFRDIVLASHLKPLEKTDKTGQRRQPWNPLASRAGKPGTAGCATLEASAFRPGTAAEFGRDWRRSGGSVEERYRLLLSLGGAGVRRTFSTEVGAGLLGEFLLVLAGGLRRGDAGAVVSLLHGLAHTGRFSLGLAFLSPGERAACAGLLGRLQDILRDGHPETEPGGAEGHPETEPGGAEGHPETEPGGAEGHPETEPGGAEGHPETEPGGAEGHPETEQEGTEGHPETEPGGAEGHPETEPGGAEGHPETEQEGTEGHPETEPGGAEGHPETEPGGAEGHPETEPGGAEGDPETEQGGTEGVPETEQGGAEGDSDTEPGGAEGDPETEPGGAEGENVLEKLERLLLLYGVHIDSSEN
ncbi:coiled-coil domain-containing protein 103 [Conger conger]|uniref:coiled-coil domain-containing protein 103 n=1 Tax=Conger conger TaxID=82655 RepID=UPI002A5B032E|nr:coiled-coil domain-containing protein 103 [Conger conger]